MASAVSPTEKDVCALKAAVLQPPAHSVPLQTVASLSLNNSDDSWVRIDCKKWSDCNKT